MKFHPLQGKKESMDRLSEIFRDSMEKRGILPKNPWKAKRLADWLAKMGARFHPGSHHIRAYQVDSANFVNFKVDCPRSQFSRKITPWATKIVQRKINGRRESRFVCIEIPWDLADKVLTLGCLP